MSRNVVQIDGGMVTAIVRTADMQNVFVPAGRLMIDVTDLPGDPVPLRAAYAGTPPLVDDWTWQAVELQTAPQVPARFWTARAGLDVFTPPAPSAPASPTVSITTFLKTVTDAEWAAFVAASAASPTFARAKAILDHALTITPTDGYFVTMMDAAVTANILTAKRRGAIMAALVPNP